MIEALSVMVAVTAEPPLIPFTIAQLTQPRQRRM
jgi:hypothetical protein